MKHVHVPLETHTLEKFLYKSDDFFTWPRRSSALLIKNMIVGLQIPGISWAFLSEIKLYVVLADDSN